MLAALLSGQNVSATPMTMLMEEMLAGRVPEAEIAAVLIALRMKGESAEELAAAAAVLRQHMTRLDTGRSGVLDTCGMGGDGSGTFNISTATALVAAGAGVPVVKHGNRGVSSHCGSADVLQELGVCITTDAAGARHCLDEAGLAFCFAPSFHPCLRQFADLRRRLKVRTMFNLLGPLANPAGAEHQLLGVARSNLLDPLAGALARLGTRNAVLVCGTDGLDEVCLSGETLVRIVRADEVSALVWTAEDFDLEPCTINELRVDTPAESARVIRQVLAGSDGPAQRIVVANTAAALVASEHAADLRDGVAQARLSIASGRAREVLDRLVHCSTAVASGSPGSSS